jgi:parallel beta-helix repeat protein
MTDLVRYLTQELPAIFGRYHASLGLPTGVRVSGGVHTPAASCTSPPFSLEAFTNAGNRVLATSSGGAFSIDYAAAGCNCQNPGSDRAWVIASATSANTLGNYVRAGSSNLFVNCTDAVQPALPADSVPLFDATITNGQLAAVNTGSVLQAMVDATPNGETVVVPAGTWTIGTSGLLIDGKTNFGLRCEDRATIKVQETSTLTIPDLGRVAVKMSNCTNCVIEGCTFDGSGSTVTSSTLGIYATTNSRIQGNIFTAGGVGGTALGGGSIVAIGNTNVQYVANQIMAGAANVAGIYLGTGTANPGTQEIGCLVANNIIHDMMATGVGGVMSDCAITGNRIYTNGGVGIGCQSLLPGLCTDLTVTGNVVRGNSYGILMSGTGAQAQNITIMGNTLTANTATGIELRNTSEVSIVGNVVRGNAIDGIRVLDGTRRVTVTGNHVSNIGSLQHNGIAVIATSGGLSDIVISANDVQDQTNEGIVAQTTSPQILRGLTITGNIVRNTSSVGIALVADVPFGIDEVVVTDNDVKNSGGTDLAIGPANASLTFTSASLHGNLFNTFSGLPSTAWSALGRPAQTTRGICGFDPSSGTCTVAFQRQEFDTLYSVQVTCNANKQYWITGKGTTSFTIGRSSLGSGEVCDWFLYR